MRSKYLQAMWINEHPMRAVIGCVGLIGGAILTLLATVYGDVSACLLGLTMTGLALTSGWRFWLFLAAITWPSAGAQVSTVSDESGARIAWRLSAYD